jgi:hypothetical protein
MRVMNYLLILGIIIAIGIIIASFIHFNNSLTFSVVFSNAQGIQKGDGLFLYGIKVGEVRQLYVEDNAAVIVVKTNSKLKTRIPQDTQFYVIDANQSQKGIEMKPGKDLIMLKRHDIVKANDTEMIDDLAKIIRTIRKLLD